MASDNTLKLVVSRAHHGWRLDRVLAALVPALSRNAARRLLRNGSVTVNRRPGRKGDVVRVGDTVELPAVAPDRPAPEPEAPLNVKLERADLLVVDKPAGQATAALTAGEKGTLAGALLGRYPDLDGVGFKRREPGLLHRLDTETSGLVLVARSQRVFRALRRAWEQNQVDKGYLAIVEGHFPTSTSVHEPLGPDPVNRRRVRVGASSRSRSATTHFELLERHPQRSLVRASAHRAYRHQVRAHLAHLGHPIVGDTTYGARDKGEGILSGARHALHAHYIAGTAAGVERFEVTIALAEDLARLLRVR